MEYQSSVERESKIYPGVRFRVARMSLGRRIELGERVRELSAKGGFLRASSDTGDQVEAALLDREVERLYIEWGLLQVEGLDIDGAPADAATVVSRGPEELTREVLEAIRAELGLSESERKN
jgi:hypothetical protein